MKKHWKAMTGLLVCVAILVVGTIGYILSNNVLVKEKKSTEVSADLSISSTEYDFVILEIVPDLSYAQLGYLQAGQEPIDIMKACKDGKAEEIKKIVGDGVEFAKGINQKKYNRLSEVYGSDKVKKYWTETTSGSAIRSKYSFAGEKEFTVNQNKLRSMFSSYLESSDDNVIVKTVTTADLNNAKASDLKTLLGKVNLVYISESYVDGAESAQKQLAEAYGKANNTGKKFTSSGCDANWDVVDAIFDKVANKENPLPIMMDKTIYDNGISASNKTVDTVQYELNRSVKYSADNKIYNVNGDLFVQRKDYPAGNSEKASNNNMYKLYLMTMFRDPVEFHNLFIESKLITGGKCPLQSGDADEYWNTYTFLPCKKEIKHEDHEKGDKDFWTKKMAITLDAKSGKWVNCNAFSFDENKIGSFLDTKDQVKKITEYKPRTGLTGRTFHVLELEPANHFSLSAAEIEQLIPYTSYTTEHTFKMEITKMTTAEFVGKIEDLATNYDLIYIGNDIEGMHTKKDGNKTITDYGEKNSDVNGVIYSHVGPKVMFNFGTASDTSNSKNKDNSNGVAFFDKGVSGSLRFSGTDITKLKKTKLETYLDTGLPIVVAQGLLEDAKSEKPTYFNDKENNNMLQLLKNHADKFVSLDFNYRTASEKEAEKKLKSLTVQKPTLKIESLSAGGKTYTDLSKCNIFEFDKNSENRKFKFVYNVKNPENTSEKFALKFYIDKNADGRFVGSECVGKQYFYGDGSDNNYSFSLNSEYTGAFTWKIEVCPINNPGMICSQVGYGTVRFTNNDSNPRVVHVLQVQAVAGDNKHNTRWGRKKARQINLSDKDFTKYLQKDEVKKDFDIKITVIDFQDFTYGQEKSKYYNTEHGGWHDPNYNEDLSRKNLQEKYDIIIFGFADSYRDLEFNNEKIAQDVQSYIDAGKSVLFSHDLTSQINNEDAIKDEKETTVFMENTNGKGFNKWMRDAMGLDRYNQGKRVDSKEQCKDYTLNGLDEKYGFTYTALMQYSNFRKNWNTGGNNQIDGWFGPYKNLYLNLLARNNNVSGKDAGKGWPYIGIADGADTPTDGQAYATQRVTEVNDGQITKYPYDLSQEKTDENGKYEISTTHGQAYQLNVESDDVVCWFALSDKANGTGWYSSSPNDASNNYYIYNKGNVTYTGVGHSTLGEMTDFEKKLFVNTIIASLRAGVEGPKPQITNGFNIPEGDEDCYMVYADVDADSKEEDFKKTEDVEFYATDDSTDSEYVYVSLELKEFDDAGDVTGKYTLVDENNNSVKPVTITKDGESHLAWKIKKTKLEDGDSEHRYTIKYPRAVLEKHSSQKFVIYAYSYEGEGKYKVKGYQYGGIMRRAQFKLD